MLLTKEQARTKWCPHARTIRVGDQPYDSSYNRVVITKNEQVNLADNDGNEQLGMMLKVGIDFVPKSSLCIASDCMAWRQPTQLNQGYCGLSGASTGPQE